MGQNYLSGDNFLINLDGLIGKERWIAGGHFIDQHSKCPPINGFIIALKGEFQFEMILRSPPC